MKLPGLVLVLALLSGCATTGGYKRMLKGWIGKPGSELVSTFGVPERVMDLEGGGRAYEYRNYTEGHLCRTTFLTGPGEDRIVRANFEGLCAR